MNARRTPPTADGIVSGWRSLRVDVLSRLFRYGTPVLVILSATGHVQWWIVLVPIFPVWFSFVTTAHAAHKRARIIRRPRRQVGLDEAATEVRFRSANTALDAAAAERTTALRALAEARAEGDREARKRSWWQRQHAGD
jgi:hypothetical protein